MKKNDSQSIKARPITSAEKVLAVLFGFGFIVGFLLTPLGVETRIPELRTLAFAGFFINRGVVDSACRAGFAVSAKTEARRRLGSNRRGAHFPHCARRPGTVLLHGLPSACCYRR